MIKETEEINKDWDKMKKDWFSGIDDILKYTLNHILHIRHNVSKIGYNDLDCYIEDLKQAFLESYDLIVLLRQGADNERWQDFLNSMSTKREYINK